MSSIFCDNCGAALPAQDKFCDNCGSAVKAVSAGEPGGRKGKGFFGLNRAVFVLILILAAGAFTFWSLKKQESFNHSLQDQKNQTAKLENQLEDLNKKTEAENELNTESNKTLNSELEKAKQQTALAQNALNVLKQQTQAAAVSSSFPSIDSRAIVLVFCLDGAGNAQTGSGTIVNAQGYIVTNKHVVTGNFGQALSCAALMNDGGPAPKLLRDTAYVLSANAPGAQYLQNYDVAILKITSAFDINTNADRSLPAAFPYIRPNGGSLKQGDLLFIFGYPSASDYVFNATRGIVSSFSSDNLYINTDAVIDHGNSGGAAITSDGRFVGIPSQKYVANNDYLGQILKIDGLPIP